MYYQAIKGGCEVIADELNKATQDYGNDIKIIQCSDGIVYSVPDDKVIMIKGKAWNLSKYFRIFGIIGETAQEFELNRLQKLYKTKSETTILQNMEADGMLNQDPDIYIY